MKKYYECTIKIVSGSYGDEYEANHADKELFCDSGDLLSEIYSAQNGCEIFDIEAEADEIPEDVILPTSIYSRPDKVYVLIQPDGDYSFFGIQEIEVPEDEEDED